ncbi:hypothetical protein QE152_g5273 [Popillia japonica]|uniref:Uncharacterized protein n=1 Tax=Popillia japonica TaxID=7064 RepID=A0AAW1MRS3_POPJA
MGRLRNIKRENTLMRDVFNVAGPAQQFWYRMVALSSNGPPNAFWRERMASSPLSIGLQNSADDAASRAWLQHTPIGWTGRDFVRAVQLRTEQAATTKKHCHVFQACPATHHERIQRHNKVVAKVASHCRRRGLTVEVEPRLYHPDRQLFIPDLAVHQRTDVITICDAQICWEGPRTLSESYDHPRFREGAARRWPGHTIRVLPLLLGVRGVWPRCNYPTVTALAIPSSLRRSCVGSCLVGQYAPQALYGFSVETTSTTTPPTPTDLDEAEKTHGGSMALERSTDNTTIRHNIYLLST